MDLAKGSREQMATAKAAHQESASDERPDTLSQNLADEKGRN